MKSLILIYLLSIGLNLQDMFAQHKNSSRTTQVSVPSRPLPATTTQQGEWKTFDSSNSGLAKNDVRAIAVSGDFIWFATYGGGLNCYQKSTEQWQTSNTANSEILSDLTRAVTVDGEYIWVGSDLGVSRFSTSAKTWQNWDFISCVSDIKPDGDEVWVATNGSGIYRYSKTLAQWSTLDSTNSGLPGNFVSAIEIDGEYVWFGTHAGAARLSKSDSSWLIYDTAGSGLGSNTINDIAIDGEQIWFGHAPGTQTSGFYTETYLNIFPPTDCPPRLLLSRLNIKYPGGANPCISRYNHGDFSWYRMEFYMPGPDVAANEKICFPVQTVATGANKVWFGTISQGAIVFDKISETCAFYNPSNSGLAGSLIWSIAFDGNDVWLGSFERGVSRFRPTQELWACYHKPDGLIDESVENISLSDDEAWFGSHKGLSCLQISTNTWSNFDPLNSDIGTFAAWIVGADSQYVWVGPSLRRYDKFANSWEVIDSSQSKLGNSLVFCIFIDRQHVWFGANDGKLSSYNKISRNWRLFDTNHTKLSGTINAIDVVGDEIWLGAPGSGASSYNIATNQWRHFDTSNCDIASNNVIALGIDGDFVWFATIGGGICRYQKSKNQWTTFDPLNTGGFFIGNVWSLEVDSGFVWFGSQSQGVFRYDKSSEAWENFDQINSPLCPGRVYDIEAGANYVWFSIFETDYSSTPIKRTGGVCRYGDLYPPEILHTPVTNEQPSTQPVLIIATVDDNVGVKFASIHFRMAGAGSFESVPMNRISGDTWLSQIPGYDVQPGTMEYYLSANDGRNKATHPYSAALNNPHAFHIYDSVPPFALASITSASGFLTDTTVITLNIEVNGTGSRPTISAISLVGYNDYSAVSAIDTIHVSFLDSTMTRDNKSLSLSGRILFRQQQTGFAGIKVMVVATDEGHDVDGRSHEIYALSNPLFRSIGGVNVSAEKGITLYDDTRRAKLYLPPNSLAHDELVRLFSLKTPAAIGFSFVSPAFQISPMDLDLRKQGILTIFLSPQEWATISDKKAVAIYYLQQTGPDSVWQATRIGGSILEQERSITTAISEFGVYAVILSEIGVDQQKPAAETIQCLPRTINPAGSIDRLQTSIAFSLQEAGNVTIKIYNPAGRLKRVITENEYLGTGTNVKSWDGRDQDNQIVSSGIYIVCVETSKGTFTQTVLVMNN